MYFVYNLLHRLNKKSSFVSANFHKIYPILSQIDQYVTHSNLFFTDTEWKWLELLIDFDSIRKCLYTERIIVVSALFEGVTQCPQSSMAAKWHKSIESLVKLLDDLNSDGMRDILLSEVIEKLISYCINGEDDDTTLVPLLITFSQI